MKSKAFLSLGSNMGDRKEHLYGALRQIKMNQHIEIVDISGIYESTSQYFISDTNFYNMVILIRTELQPKDLLKSTKAIECISGRVSGHNKSRQIDIDILTYDDIEIEVKNLTIPHPRIKERKFVLLPWKEIDNNYKLPGSNLKINKLLERVKGDIMCKKIYNKPLEKSFYV